MHHVSPPSAVQATRLQCLQRGFALPLVWSSHSVLSPHDFIMVWQQHVSVAPLHALEAQFHPVLIQLKCGSCACLSPDLESSDWLTWDGMQCVEGSLPSIKLSIPVEAFHSSGYHCVGISLINNLQSRYTQCVHDSEDPDGLAWRCQQWCWIDIKFNKVRYVTDFDSGWDYTLRVTWETIIVDLTDSVMYYSSPKRTGFCSILHISQVLEALDSCCWRDWLVRTCPSFGHHMPNEA